MKSYFVKDFCSISKIECKNFSCKLSTKSFRIDVKDQFPMIFENLSIKSQQNTILVQTLGLIFEFLQSWILSNWPLIKRNEKSSNFARFHHISVVCFFADFQLLSCVGETWKSFETVFGATPFDVFVLNFFTNRQILGTDPTSHVIDWKSSKKFH